MSFADSLAFFLVLVVLNGFFQGFGVGPSFSTLAKWYPKQERGRYGAIWNISHNLGGGIVANRYGRDYISPLQIIGN